MGMSCMRTFQAEHPVEPACIKADIPLDFDTLNEYGCFIGSAAIVVLSNQDTASGAARNDEVLLRGILRPMYAVPRQYRQGAPVDGAEALGCSTLKGAIPRHDGLIDLQAGPGCAKSGAHRLEILSRRSRVMPVSFNLNGETVVCGSNETILEVAGSTDRDSAPLLHEGHEAGRQLPHLHGGDQGRAGAGPLLLPLSQGRNGCRHQQQARSDQPENVH